jgi:hypothetical protein
MTTLDVLLVGGDQIATEQVQDRLEAAGHVVHRCHLPDAPAFPCVGLADPSVCPIEEGVDVAVLVRRGIRREALAEEDGARCAIRAGVPLVEDGPDLLDPFDPWVAERVGPDDDLSTVCHLAADRRHAHLRMLVRERIAKLAAAAGTSSSETTCLVRTSGRDLVVDLHLPVALERPMQQALAVRVLDAVHASGRTYGQVDVNVHGHTR